MNNEAVRRVLQDKYEENWNGDKEDILNSKILVIPFLILFGLRKILKAGQILFGARRLKKRRQIFL